MPENYIAMFDAPGEEVSEKIRRRAERGIKKACNLICEVQPLPDKKISILDRIKSGMVNKAFYSFSIKSKAFRTKAACNSCGKCAKNCPVGGIEMENGKPVWTGDCTHCMACICGCPKSAIEYGKRSVGKVRYQCPHYHPED